MLTNSYIGAVPKPRSWLETIAVALGNLGRGIVETFSNGRLWSGLAISLLLHALIVLLTSDLLKGRTLGDDTIDLTAVVYDESLPPKAQKIVQQQQLSTPAAPTSTEGAPIDLSKGKQTFQAKMEVDDFSLDKSEASFSGDVIRIDKNRALSTDDILQQSAIELKRSTGGLGSSSAFDRIAASGGSSIELNSGATSIGAEEVKPKFSGNSDLKANAKTAASGANKSGFSLSGDLSQGDILRGGMPAYPPWARQKGLSNVRISIQFSVDANGNVQPTMVVKRTTGYPNWDKLVKQRLASWKFKPAPGTPKRRGIITFMFVLT